MRFLLVSFAFCLCHAYGDFQVAWLDQSLSASADIPIIDADGGLEFVDFSDRVINPAQPSRLTYRLDVASELWDLYVNGELVLYDSPLADAEAIEGLLSYFEDNSQIELKLLESNPLFADADSDGMPDEYEIANFLDPNLSDRNEDANGNGISNFEEYLLSQGIVAYGPGMASAHGLFSAVSGSGASGGNSSQAGEGESTTPDAPGTQEDEQGNSLFYTSDAQGNDGYDGRAASPKGGISGPKFNIRSAINASDDGGTVVIQSEGQGYEESIIHLNGKSVVLRPKGNVVIHAKVPDA